MFHKFKNLIKLKKFPKSVEKHFAMSAREAPSLGVVSATDPNAVTLARDLLAAGEVIALPTDTVYGLACDANNAQAIQKVYGIKGREEKKPVAICVAEIDDFQLWGCTEYLPREMLQQLLPGAVTLVVDKSPRLANPYLNPGIQRIGIRIPDAAFIRDISRAFRMPIALTSANRSSEPSSLSVGEFQALWPQLGAVFDGGRLGVTETQRAASTVVNLYSDCTYSIKRRGVAMQETEAVLRKFNFNEDNNKENM
uniref:Threonylcarbamoyl-AMP synthase n=1 Tax=Nyssomyia neivai TaxID=330878 RepID=A0A1L8DHN9_9DIPT